MQIIKTLNGLRGLAAIFVILSHFPQVGDSVFSMYLRQFLYNSKLAYFGVDIFFVLSGFLITRNMLYALRLDKFSLKKFYIKRTLRIFPIYYLTVFLSYFILNKEYLLSLSTYVSNITFAIYKEPHPLRTTWSLAVEEQFYLFWPFLVIYFFKKKIENFGFKLVLFVIINIIAVYILFDIDIANGLVYRSTLIRVLTLGLGGLIAFKENKIKDIKINKYLAVFIFIFCYFFGALGKYNPLSDFMPSSVIKLFCFGIVAIIFFLWVLKLNDKKTGLFYNFFASSFLAKAGLISYGLYLYHYPILYYFGYDPKSFTGSINIKEAILLISLIISISIFSYNLIEKPILKFKDKLK